MKRALGRSLALACSIAAFSLPSHAGAQEARNGQPLLDALRHGGYVIVFRHATTEAKPDAAHVDLADCSTQRNLSPDGRTMARSINTAFTQLHIPVGRVVSSPFCRAEETATLAFGHEEPVAGLGDKAVKDQSTAAEAASTLKTVIESSAVAGPNTIVVTHGFNIKSVVGDDVVEGEATVFKPDGNGGFTQITRVLPQDWATLAR
jgi:broad specificity phosphatase PhoE